MIYICTHKDFNEKVNPVGHTILSANKLSNNYGVPVIKADNKLKPLEYAYAEGYMIYDLYEHNVKDEIIGIRHYSRYLDFEYIPPTFRVTLPIPYSVNVRAQYDVCHNVEDLDCVEEIARRTHPNMSYTHFANMNGLYAHNMFIMNNSDFRNYCEFVFDVLERFSDLHGFKTDNDVRDYANSRPDTHNGMGVGYAQRIHGFLMERLGTMFFVNYFDKDFLVNKVFSTRVVSLDIAKTYEPGKYSK